MPSKTVYSLYWPKTQTIYESLSKTLNHELFKETWSKSQDAIGPEFLSQWIEWVSPGLSFDQENFNFRYPTAGSSEAIREVIVDLNVKNTTLIVFKGEYEGYTAIATALKMPVVQIDRDNWLEELNSLELTKKAFFISNPSSIDGNYWPEFEDFLNFCENQKIPLYLDFAYLGISRPSFINLCNKECVSGIFFSLSKIFGCYYHRIGGVFLKKENPLLYGNMWFKSIPSIEFGKYLLSNYSFNEGYDLYKEYQLKAINEISKVHGFKTLKQSDVLFLANIDKKELERSLFNLKDFERNPNSSQIRICLTPEIEGLIRK